MKKEGGCDCCNNDFGVASVVLGLIGLVSSIVVLPVVICVVGLTFGIIQYKKAKNAWAVWGIILSALGIIIALFVLWKLFAISSDMQQLLQTCTADPSLPGCENLAGVLAGAQ